MMHKDVLRGLHGRYVVIYAHGVDFEGWLDSGEALANADIILIGRHRRDDGTVTDGTIVAISSIDAISETEP